MDRLLLSLIARTLKKQEKFLEDRNKESQKNISFKKKWDYKSLLKYVIFHGELQNDGVYILEYEKNGTVVSINVRYGKSIMLHSIYKDSSYCDDYTGLEIFDDNSAIFNKGIVDDNNGKIYIKEKFNINDQKEVEDWIKIYINSHILCDKVTRGKKSISDNL